MILARKPRVWPSCSAAPKVWSVDWPLTYRTRAKARTRLQRSSNVICAPPIHVLESDDRLLIQKRATPPKESRPESTRAGTNRGNIDAQMRPHGPGAGRQKR